MSCKELEVLRFWPFFRLQTRLCRVTMSRTVDAVRNGICLCGKYVVQGHVLLWLCAVIPDFFFFLAFYISFVLPN